MVICHKNIFHCWQQTYNSTHLKKFPFNANLSSNPHATLGDVALLSGIIKGDEIMVINGAIVSDLDMMYLESVLQEEVGLCMMMRSSRTEPPDLTGIMRVTDDIIESLVCPPPPTDPPVISEEMISGLIVPAPGWSEFFSFSLSFENLLH